MGADGILAQFSLRGLKHGGIGLRHDPCGDTTVVTVSEPWTLATFVQDALTHARACPVSGALDPLVIGARDADWQVQSVGFLAQGDIYGASLHHWRIKIGERDICAYRLLTEQRPGWPSIIRAPNGLVLFIRRTDDPCDCERLGVKLEEVPEL